MNQDGKCLHSFTVSRIIYWRNGDFRVISLCILNLKIGAILDSIDYEPDTESTNGTREMTKKITDYYYKVSS
jgi:hypothetical protein